MPTASMLVRIGGSVVYGDAKPIQRTILQKFPHVLVTRVEIQKSQQNTEWQHHNFVMSWLFVSQS